MKREKEACENDKLEKRSERKCQISPTFNKNGTNSPTFYKVNKFTHYSSRFQTPQRVLLMRCELRSKITSIVHTCTCTGIQVTCVVHATLSAKKLYSPAPARLCHGAAIINHFEASNHLSVLQQTKNIELNHDDTFAEPNVQYRACWVNNQSDCTAPAHHASLLFQF